MNFFQKLFGGKDEAKEETKVQNEAKDFDVLKYDGVRAMKTGEVDYAITCFRNSRRLRNTRLPFCFVYRKEHAFRGLRRTTNTQRSPTR